MKRRKLQAKSLDPRDLKKATGGRGSQCGSEIHCDNCGTTYPMCAEFYEYFINGYGACFNCGAG